MNGKRPERQWRRPTSRVLELPESCRRLQLKLDRSGLLGKDDATALR